MEKLLQVQAIIVKVSTMSNRSLRVIADTDENLTDEQVAAIAALHEKKGHWCFLKERPIEAEDALNLPPLTKKEGEKSWSQKLRTAIYYLGKSKGVEDDEAFYEQTMRTLVNHVQDKTG